MLQMGAQKRPRFTIKRSRSLPLRDRMAAFPASGEINSKLAQPVEAINRVDCTELHGCRSQWADPLPRFYAAGLHVVEALGLDEKQVFKTLVGKGDKTGFVVFCIPVAEELDMKQAARVSHNKSVELIHVKDLLGITGYLRGGCSPVGMKKSFPTYFDATMEPQEFVYVSAGLRGMQMKVNPKNLASVVNAEFVSLTMDH